MGGVRPGSFFDRSVFAAKFAERNFLFSNVIGSKNRFRRDFLAAYISASSDPATYGKITVLTIPGQVNGPKLAFNAISTDTAVFQDLGVIGRDNQNRIRWGNLLTLPVGQGCRAATA